MPIPTSSSPGRPLATATPIVSSPTAPTKGTSNKVARQDHAHPRYDWQPADYGLISSNFSLDMVSGSNTPLGTAGTMYVFRLHIPVATSITNIIAYVSTAGGTLTSGQCFGALYQNGTLLGQTADQSTAWASINVKTMAITGGPVAVAAGDIYVALWFNGTTGPAFYRSGGTGGFMNLGLASTVSKYGTANTSITTTAPGTLGTISQAGVGYWVGVS